MDHTLLQQLTAQQCSTQWKGFLDVFAQELTQQLTTNNLRLLAKRAGVNFAEQHVLAVSETVAGLQTTINQLWAQQQWGQVVLQEEPTHLVITHYCSPLLSAFQAQNLNWAAGFLEGVYETWLYLSGASRQLHVTQAGPADSLGTLVFHFGR